MDLRVSPHLSTAGLCAAMTLMRLMDSHRWWRLVASTTTSRHSAATAWVPMALAAACSVSAGCSASANKKQSKEDVSETKPARNSKSEQTLN